MRRLTPPWTFASLLATFLILIPPATAQEANRSVEDNEIVVTGRQFLAPDEFERAVEDFVKDLGQPGPINRISRWGEPLCPKAGASPSRSTRSSRLGSRKLPNEWAPPGLRSAPRRATFSCSSLPSRTR